MMREIKFRAWDNRTKEMCGVEINDLIIIRDGKLIISDRFTIMQFTGLKDKDGKDIYEGDVVKVKNPYGKKKFTKLYPKFLNGVVKNDKGWNFYVCINEWVKEELGFSEVQHLNPSSEDMEILGNIYENPELLEKQDE